ncbi:MAG: hypothetical protein U5K38_07085 [Woeseiaceae bacterium]|nr:hypothetical protein [Woeseiaceae bacterium]
MDTSKAHFEACSKGRWVDVTGVAVSAFNVEAELTAGPLPILLSTLEKIVADEYGDITAWNQSFPSDKWFSPKSFCHIGVKSQREFKR